MIAKTLYSSKHDDWGTPQVLFDRLHEIYDFQLDAAASPRNAKCPRFFTTKDDALTKSWLEYQRIWLNPPYGRNIGDWMKKAFEESRRGALVVCLVHARTDTRWWHNWVESKAQVTFLKGRLKFTRGENSEIAQSAPFPSVLVVYDPRLHAGIHHSCGTVSTS